MKYSFTCYGHENITARHKTTLEFTKDEDLSLKGDCIVGVKASFQLNKIKHFIKTMDNNKKITIIMERINNNSKNKIVERINAEINPGFNSDKDIVIRKSDFKDYRTLAINSDKASCDLSSGMIDTLKNINQKVKIILS